MTRAEIADALGRSPVAVGRQCRINNIECKNNRPSSWSEAEHIYLRENYTGKNCKQIAEALDRPFSTVAYKCKLLKEGKDI